MPDSPVPLIGILFAQFAAYHVDRCEAVARRLSGRARVLAVEVATTSQVYAWEPSGDVAGAAKVTLFPGQSYDSLPRLARLRAQWRALRKCDWVLVGIGYNEPDVIALSWLLRLSGVKGVMLTESKADDFPRSAGTELAKSLILRAYAAAIVGGARQAAYVRSLGFARRTVLPGYDGVSLERIRAQGGGVLAPDGAAFEDRPFIYVGRFVAKKNLIELIEGYARYRELAGPAARRLVLAGSGPEEAAMRARIDLLGLGDAIEFPGFLTAEQVSGRLAGALALVLVSREEQWGLVVNEALAFGLPAIVSIPVGSRDALVRNLVNGYLVECGSTEGIAAAMQALAADRAAWQAMVAASHERAWLGDTERLADAVELLLDPQAEPARTRAEHFKTATGTWN